MRNKKYNTVNDFLNDDSFKNWALKSQLTDVSFWDFWLENNPDKIEIAQEAKDIIVGLKFKSKTVSEEKINLEWNKLASKLSNEKVVSNKKGSSYKWISIAASLILFISISIYFLNSDKKITHSTNYGEVLNLKLKDGSLVTLNSNSSISYFENDSRKVWLEGEANFEVDKKETSNAKFWVYTDDLTVEVYGTIFNVNTNRKKTSVFLEEGNIWLELKNGATKKMNPGNYITYSSQKNKILDQKKHQETSLISSWKNGTIIFKELPIVKAIERIEDSYGVKAIFKDNLSKQKLITGAVPITNLKKCLIAFEKAVDIKITKVGSELHIQNK